MEAACPNRLHAFLCLPRTCCQCSYTSMHRCCFALPAASSGTACAALSRRRLALAAARLQPWLAVPRARWELMWRQPAHASPNVAARRCCIAPSVHAHRLA